MGREGDIRVFVVDEHEVTRRGVISVLASDARLRVVGEAGSVSQALARGPAVRPDVVVLAMRFPDGSGADVCERLRALVPGVRVLVLSRCSDRETVRAAVRAGASGYLVKQVPAAELVAAIRRVACGEGVFGRLARAALSGPAVDGMADRLARLTPRERTVLRLIGEGLTNREIGQRLQLAEKTVKNNTSELLAKLGLGNRTQAAILVARLRDQRHEGGTA
jgi:DNA-binding NarL/FixJ family response regulator